MSRMKGYQSLAKGSMIDEEIGRRTVESGGASCKSLHYAEVRKRQTENRPVGGNDQKRLPDYENFKFSDESKRSSLHKNVTKTVKFQVDSKNSSQLTSPKLVLKKT